MCDVMCCSYLTALIELCAEICLGRNKMAITEVSHAFPFDAVMAILSDMRVLPKATSKYDPFTLRTALCRLVCLVYLEAEPNHALEFPKRTRVFRESSLALPCSPHAASFDQLKRFVEAHVSSLNGVMIADEVRACV